MKTIDRDSQAPAEPAPRPRRRRRAAGRERTDPFSALVAELRNGAGGPGRHIDLLPPPMPRSHIPRPRLSRRLQEGEAATILLSAPAGYGKSTLLAEWMALEGRPLAWLTLDPDDEDPDRLLSRLLQALQLLAGGARAHEPAPAAESADLAADLDALRALASAVGCREEGVVLVLDDVHNAGSRASSAVLAALLEARPGRLQVALASRSEPTLGLGRLRAAGRLLQLGPADLEMTGYEAGLVLSATGLDLGEPDLARLVDYTEGWAAALYLAAISLRSRPDAGADVVEAVRESPEIRAYVLEEVLAPLPRPARSFLMRTSILDQLSAGLCDAVLGEEGSGARISSIAARSLMLAEQHPGHGWYRCHALVRDVLRAELELREPAAAVPLRLRASGWYQEHQDLDRAIDQAVAAGDGDRVARLLWSHAARYGSPADPRSDRWLAPFDEDALAASPGLALCAAFHALVRGDVCIADARARRVASGMRRGEEPSMPRSMLAGIAVIESAVGAGGIEQMRADAERAQGMLGDASPLRPLASLLAGVAASLVGEPGQARQALNEAVRLSEGALPQLEALALSQLSLLDVSDGDWEQAGDRVDRAAQALRSHGLERHPTSAMTHAVCALVCSRQGVADEAKRELARASRLLDELGEYMPWHEVQARIVMARACARLADVTRARALLSQASRWARRMERVESMIAALDAAWGEVDDVSAAALEGPGTLTMAELRVLRFLPTHLSFREIGERLHVSGNTVKTQAHAVYAKLGAASRSEAVTQAAGLGLVDVTIV
jgi:LuxR family maltose regulon positive regulatory protein